MIRRGSRIPLALVVVMERRMRIRVRSGVVVVRPLALLLALFLINMTLWFVQDAMFVGSIGLVSVLKNLGGSRSVNQQRRSGLTETLHLLEVVMHYDDDWKRVAEHVAGRSEKDCVARFIKLPFGEQFSEPADLSTEGSISSQIKGQVDAECGGEPDAKKMRLTPLTDARNPMMAQAAFLSALAGVEVSEAAAQAAVATLYDMGHLTSRGSSHSQALPPKEQENGSGSSDKSSLHASEEARIVAERQRKQEEDEYVKSISTITELKIKVMLERIGRLEEMGYQLETDWQEWHQMKHQLFLDKLSLLFHNAAASKTPENVAEKNVRTELTPSS